MGKSSAALFSVGLLSVALIVFGVIFVVAGIFAPTNEIIVKVPLMSVITEIDRNGRLVITGTGTDAQWLEIGQGIVMIAIGYMLLPRKWTTHL